MFEGGNIVGYLDDVVEGDAGCLVEFKEQEVGQGRLRPLDLRGKHRLLADVGVEKEVPIRKVSRDTIEPAQRQHCHFQFLLERAFKNQGWDRRKGSRYESANLLVSDGQDLITACFSTFQGLETLLSSKSY